MRKLLIILFFFAFTNLKAQNDTTYFDDGIVQTNKQEYEEAISDYTRAIKINPNYADAYFYRGCAKHKIQDYKGAISDFSKAIKVNPNYVDAYYYRGLCKDDLARFEANKGKKKISDPISDSLMEKSLGTRTSNILRNLSKINYTNLSKDDAEETLRMVDEQLHQLLSESKHDSTESAPVKEAKQRAVHLLKKEKQLQQTVIEREDLKIEVDLYKNWLILVAILITILTIIIGLITRNLIQKKKIEKLHGKIVKQFDDIQSKNGFLEYAARLIRHDMHSGINTYIPRGITSLEKRLTEDDIKNLKIESPLKILKDGLAHTQKVYKEIYNFTNLVKKETVIEKKSENIKEILEVFLASTGYKNQVEISENLPNLMVNDYLFEIAIDHLIRNGLKYNDSVNKVVKIYAEEEYICIEDNGRGMTQEEFLHLSKPYVRRQDQKETGDGIGLNICLTILKEHGFTISSEKLEPVGTKLKIKIR
jgi:tetratricopeptide (TPR) repeat protein